MTADRSIFGLRFGSNAEITPTNEELDQFINNAFKTGTKEFFLSDLHAYSDMIENLTAFRQDVQQGASRSPRETMFYRALDNSQFAHPGLKRAVEQFLYHLHSFSQTDFRKPLLFIRAAGEEISKLDPKKKSDALRLARLQDLVLERKRALADLRKQAEVLTGELRLIMIYIRDNLVRIEKLCEASIVSLVELQLSRQQEGRLVDDLRAHFEEELGAPAGHDVNGKDCQAVSDRDAAILSKEMVTLFREDIYALACLYESIHDHAAEVIGKMDLLLKEIDGGAKRKFEEDRELYARASTLLAYLIAGHRFDLKTTEYHSETTFGHLVEEERKEMHSQLFALLERERRTRNDRRSGKDRRGFWETALKGPERRNHPDRRTGKGRRTDLPLYSQKTRRP